MVGASRSLLRLANFHGIWSLPAPHSVPHSSCLSSIPQTCQGTPPAFDLCIRNLGPHSDLCPVVLTRVSENMRAPPFGFLLHSPLFDLTLMWGPPQNSLGTQNFTYGKCRGVQFPWVHLLVPSGHLLVGKCFCLPSPGRTVLSSDQILQNQRPVSCGRSAAHLTLALLFIVVLLCVLHPGIISQIHDLPPSFCLGLCSFGELRRKPLIPRIVRKWPLGMLGWSWFTHQSREQSHYGV